MVDNRLVRRTCGCGRDIVKCVLDGAVKAEVQVRRQSAPEVSKQSTLNRSRDKRLPTSQRLCLVKRLRIAPMAGFAILFLCLAYLLRTEDALGLVIYLQRYISTDAPLLPHFMIPNIAKGHCRAAST